LAKAEVQKTVELLALKGVNIAEIEVQSNSTEEKIAELDKKIEELPSIQEDLIVQYKREKEERLRLNQSVDTVKERSEENLRLFIMSNKELGKPDSINNRQIHNENQNEDRNINSISPRR